MSRPRRARDRINPGTLAIPAMVVAAWSTAWVLGVAPAADPEAGAPAPVHRPGVAVHRQPVALPAPGVAAPAGPAAAPPAPAPAAPPGGGAPVAAGPRLSDQVAALERLRGRDPELGVSWRTGSDPAPTFVYGRLSDPGAVPADAIARAFLAENAAVFGIRDLDLELAQNAPGSQLTADECGVRHVRFDQVVNGLPVYQRTLTVHVGPDGVVRAVHGRFTPGLDPAAIPSVPGVAADLAHAAALVHAGVTGPTEPLGAPELVVSLLGPEPALCWRTEIVSVGDLIAVTCLVDAGTGEVQTTLERACSDGPPSPPDPKKVLEEGTKAAENLVEHDSEGGGTDPFGRSIRIHTTSVGVDPPRDPVTGNDPPPTYSKHLLHDRTRDSHVITHDWHQEVVEQPDPQQNPRLPPQLPQVCEDADNNWAEGSQAHEIAIHYHLGQTLDYYREVHGRRGSDGHDAPVMAAAHARFRNEDGTITRNNAMSLSTWRWLVFGDGQDGWRTCTSLNACAHEFTHSVIARTSGLVYRNESGAANESFADVFGTFVEKRCGNAAGGRNWVIGEDDTTDGSGIRDMADPPAHHQPDHMSEYEDTTRDHGGVHINSGILNKAAFLLTDGGVHPDSGVYVAGIGYHHARKAYYRAMVNYLGAGSNFDDVRAAVIQAVADLIVSDGWNAGERTSAEEAFNAVGVYGTTIDLVALAEYSNTHWFRPLAPPATAPHLNPAIEVPFRAIAWAGSAGYWKGALEDGTAATTARNARLAMYPQAASGWVEGRYELLVPSNSGTARPRLELKVGFPAIPTATTNVATTVPVTTSFPGGTRGAQVTIDFMPDGGSDQLVWQRDLLQDGRLDTASVDLSQYAGKKGILIVRATTTGAVNAAVVFGQLRLVR